MKNRLWIILFGLLVLAYGLSQYWQEQRSNKFESVLLDFVPKDVIRIDIQKATTPAFSIIRHDDRWLLSQKQLNEEAMAEPVEELIRCLRDIRTSVLVSQQKKDWTNYGVGPDQGILLCLHFRAKPETCVRIGKYTYSQAKRKVQAYTRLENQKEVFTINGLALSMFTGEMDAFRNDQLLAIKGSADSLVFARDSSTATLRQTVAGNYITTGDASDDSLLWATYLQQLHDLQGDFFADDIDELSIDSLLRWQLKIYSKGDSVVLKCYQDTNRQEPYLLHSSQFPGTWISSDSNGLYQQLVRPWQKTQQ